jgi:iron-sulfur cluster repair protein YtfE (RIC family)
MDSQSSISYYMLEDHKMLDKMLGQVLDGFDLDQNGIKNLFQEFKDKLEKHMQTEEQAIFSFSNLGDDEAMRIVRELLVEHGAIRNRLEEMSLLIIKGQKPEDFDDFVKLLNKHQSIESDVLYPKLDKDLKYDEKKFVLQKINSLR